MPPVPTHWQTTTWTGFLPDTPDTARSFYKWIFSHCPCSTLCSIQIMQPTAKLKQHQTIVNISLWPLTSGKATSRSCRERRGVRAAPPRQSSRVLCCHGVRSWALCGLQTRGCQSSSSGAGSPDASSATLSGPPWRCLCGLWCLWALQRHFLEELLSGGNPDLASTFPSLAQGSLCQHEAQLSRGWLPWWEVGLEPRNGLGCQAHVSWAHSQWSWDASTRSLLSVLGSHLAKRTGNLDDLELLWPPVLDVFPLPAASPTA